MYQLIHGLNGAVTILRVADQVFIPFDECNSDYTAYLAWLAAGGIPEDVYI